MPQIPSGAVTFLFTDIEGSTRLLKELRDEYPGALEEHQRLLRSAFDEAGGREIDTQGDAFFVVFHRARDAVVAALVGQRLLAEHKWPQGSQLRVRMGIHTGEASVSGERYLGVAVHRAARICAAGHGGQVLVSQTAKNVLEDEEVELPDVDFRDLGEQRLKDLDRPVRLYQLIAPGLAEEFPPLRTADTPFAGREGELARAAEDVPKSRLGKRWVLAAAAIGVIAIVGVVVGVLTASGSSRPSLVPPNSLAAIDPQSGKVVSHVAIGSQLRTGAGTLPVGRSIAVGPGAVWVVNPNDATISRVDPQTGRVSQIGGIGGTVTDIATAPDGVWATLRSAGLAHIDPGSNSAETVEPSVRGGFRPSYDGIAVRSRALFLGRSDLHGLSLDRFDTRKQGLGGSVHVGQDADHAIATGLGAVWITDRADNSVTEVSPGRMSFVGRASVAGPGALAVGAGKVWVTDQIDNQLWYLVPAALKVPQPPVAVGNQPVGVAYGDGFVWVTNFGDGTVYKIDPTTKDVVKRIKVGRHVSSIAVGPGKVWVVVPPALPSPS